MKRRGPRDIGRIFAEGVLIDEAIRQAGREARRRHKQAGHPIIGWHKGKVVRVMPEEIECDSGIGER